MKRGGMYDRDAREAVGCLIALVLFSILGYVVAYGVIIAVVMRVVARLFA